MKALAAHGVAGSMQRRKRQSLFGSRLDSSRLNPAYYVGVLLSTAIGRWRPSPAPFAKVRPLSLQ
jgi:hypothetical protein